MNPSQLTVNGKKVPFVKYGKYPEIILWWALDGMVAKIPKPVPPREDNFWTQWTVAYKNAANVYDGYADKKTPGWPALNKTDGILSPFQDLVFGPNTIINIVKTDKA